MGRKKVRLELITKESTRKTTFRKRKVGLLKKAFELATLCGIKGCAVIYGPNEAEPYVWPSEEEAAKVLKRFRALPPKKQVKHMKNHEECLDGNLKNPERKVMEGRRRKNREMELEMLLCQLQEVDGDDEELFKMMSLEDMMSLLDFLDKRVEEDIPSSDGHTPDRHHQRSEEEEEDADTTKRPRKRNRPAAPGCN
ncbi:hypothetical protein SAY86_004646 [Trapa natans]|uniref:MADS-box domain-containing protein n=1 Tax=Trapa natans TaxID=22666 RepID=A0AAN7RFQ8_TRANT|nr:hypothetical protein SAY86_004646 [Trapa natans]